MKRLRYLSILIVLALSVAALGAVLAGCTSKGGLDTNPLVLDVGKVYEYNGDGTEYYSVVWGSAQKSAGFVTYTYNGRDYKVYSENEGKVRVGYTHAVHVPREHLNNNTYRTNTCKVNAERAYYSDISAPKASEPFEFKGAYEDKEEVNFISMSDWHGRLDNMNKTLSNITEEADLILMMGDAEDINDEYTLIRTIIKAGADATKSVIPALYVRGNHETRGAGGHNLASKLGMHSLYYQLERGNFLFTAFDMGEDKTDDHAEYGGLAAFSQYHQRQTAWIENLDTEKTKSFKYNIMLCHNINFCGADATVAERWRATAEKMSPDFIIGGHSHTLRYILPQNMGGEIPEDLRGKERYKLTSYLQIEDGGKQGNFEDYIVCLLNIKNRSMTLKPYGMTGRYAKDGKTVTWDFDFAEMYGA